MSCEFTYGDPVLTDCLSQIHVSMPRFPQSLLGPGTIEGLLALYLGLDGIEKRHFDGNSRPTPETSSTVETHLVPNVIRLKMTARNF